MSRWAGRNLDDKSDDWFDGVSPREILLALLADLPARTHWSIDQNSDRVVTRILIGPMELRP